DSSVVEAVLVSPDVALALRPGSVVVDMSSSEPDRTRTLARRLQDASVALVDAPVSGGVARARTGELAVMVGGDEATIARVEPVLRHFGRVLRAGPVGAGHAVKALNNLMSATHLLVSSEAIIAGRAFGLDPEVILDIVNASSGRSGSTEIKWPNFILNGTFNSGFSLRLMLKDMRIAAGLAEKLGAPDPLSRRAVEIWADAAEALPETADHTEIARWLEQHRSPQVPAAHQPS
ncbi:MAG: NAD(P)-dependent oxidoreductase, partial [Acidimicrobiaceae bacterium]|nr:NAD(P)-dependent oxidoreductase [Acidimicrobiaceae bacterium]